VIKRVGLTISAVSISMALVLTGCGASSPRGPVGPQQGNQHVEDCDFDDMLEGDSDCDRKKKTSTSKPSSKKPTAAPTAKKPASTPKKK
jgi:hypothetical protein